MFTNVVRAVCVLILMAFAVGVGAVALQFHRAGMARLHAWHRRHARVDPHARWIRALGREEVR